MTAGLTLALWAGRRQVGDITHDPLDGGWTLAYAPDWQVDPQAWPRSPALPLQPPVSGYASASVRRFLENLLPEGRALDIVAANRGVAKSNVFGLIQALGTETTGALRFLPPGEDGCLDPAPRPWRETTLQELDQRIADRAQRPFVEWDGQVRMSIAGYQDKLPVFIDGDLAAGGRLVLPDWPLASTHLLKPQPDEAGVPHMVINEHFCMKLAQALGLPVAEVSLLRTPRPVLVVRRFDRAVHRNAGEGGIRVDRRHVIDTCQCADLPVSYKYERHIGSTGPAALHRDGVDLGRRKRRDCRWKLSSDCRRQ